MLEGESPSIVADGAHDDASALTVLCGAATPPVNRRT